MRGYSLKGSELLISLRTSLLLQNRLTFIVLIDATGPCPKQPETGPFSDTFPPYSHIHASVRLVTCSLEPHMCSDPRRPTYISTHSCCTWTMSGEEYKMWRFSLRNFLYLFDPPFLLIQVFPRQFVLKRHQCIFSLGISFTLHKILTNSDGDKFYSRLQYFNLSLSKRAYVRCIVLQYAR
jgi:hypothetical protein